MSYDSPSVDDEKPAKNDKPEVHTPPDEEEKNRDPLGGDTMADMEGEIDPSDVE